MALRYSPARTGRSSCRSTSRRPSSAPSVWARWLRFDPARLAREEEHRRTLRELRAVWIDSGVSDEYHLELGAIAFHRRWSPRGTPEDRVHFELFPGTHRGLTWRYPLSLAFLVERLSSTL